MTTSRTSAMNAELENHLNGAKVLTDLKHCAMHVGYVGPNGPRKNLWTVAESESFYMVF